MKDKFELEVEAKLENLSVISDFIVDSMREFGLTERKIFDVQLAADEACSNIINYGYTDTEDVGVINIICSKRDNEVEIVISDAGKPFDPTSVPTPDLNASLEERDIGGLGIYFMKKLTDEIKYEFIDGKNVLTMVVHARNDGTG
jgi:serine/threonine-protein kinase RsbW